MQRFWNYSLPHAKQSITTIENQILIDSELILFFFIIIIGN